jgi:hypothetical protein
MIGHGWPLSGIYYERNLVAWKQQWNEEVRNVHRESVVDITDISFVQDMTEEKTVYHKNMDLQNLESTSWKNFVECFEKYLPCQ